MKDKYQVVCETERLKKLASTCEDEEMRQNLVTQINTLLWVHDAHYDS